MFKIIQFALLCFVLRALMGCEGDLSTVDYNYGSRLRTVTVVTVDQFDNSVSGRILLNDSVLGVSEAELKFDPAQGGMISFFELPGYTAPEPVPLSAVTDGQRLHAAYTRLGSVANVCPHPVNDQGLLIDMPLNINGLAVDPMTGCQSVDTTADTDIVGGDPFFIPANALTAGQTYDYDLVFGNSPSNFISMATTPVSGEIFVSGRSVGWVRQDFLSVRIPMEGNVLFTFGNVPGHQTAESMTIVSEDVTYENNHFWALYDAQVNALACFASVQNGGSPVGGRVLLDETTKLNTEYSYPGCIGLDASQTHTAEFLERDSFQSTDTLTISTADHVGCEGDFVPGARLDCVGQYYYVQPVTEQTQFSVQVNFTGSYKGDNAYPIEGRYEVSGIDHQQMSFSQVLELSESVTITMLPIGILQPDQGTLVIDAATLTQSDPAYDPQYNQWVYTVHYTPPVGAVEACVTSLNQNLVNISTQVEIQFDGVRGINAWDADQDCGWFAAAGNHVIVPNWLQGYQPAVDEMHIPEGMISQQSSFTMLFIPTVTSHQLCIDGVTIEAGLTLNSYFLGWTYVGQVCVRMDKSVPNTLTIDGVGSRSYVADDPALAGTFSSIPFADF